MTGGGAAVADRDGLRQRRREPDAPAEAQQAEDERMGAPQPPQQPYQPILDEFGNLVPQPTMMQEMIALHPIAYATVSARMIAFAGVLAFGLVIHCALITTALYPDDPGHERNVCLRNLCLCRILSGIPRPYGWWRIYRLHMEARRQPTELLVAYRCLNANNDRWVTLNGRLNILYNLWLCGVLCYLVFRFYRSGKSRTLFEAGLLQHCIGCLAFLLLQKVLSACAMLFAIHHSEDEKILHRETLANNTDCVVVDKALSCELSADPCIICFGAFEFGERARRLNQCRHIFHQACIDQWLLERRPRSISATSALSCPVCASAISAKVEDGSNDPVVARELAWLAELQRNR